MRLTPCRHEAEIRPLLARGQWPLCAAPDLLVHAQDCGECAELVKVTQAFLGARAQSFRAARLPSPGLIWWKAQLRRRNEAMERINRPILGAQIFALAASLTMGVVLAFSLVGSSSQWSAPPGAGLGVWLKEWIAPYSQLGEFHLSSLRSGAGLMYLLPCLALLGGVVAYAASDEPDKLDRLGNLNKLGKLDSLDKPGNLHKSDKA